MAPEDPVTVRPPPPPPPTPSLKAKIARRFVKSLAEVWTSRKPATQGSVGKRAQKIKIAAYSSMARAAGSRRAWSRALLAKLQGRGKRCRHLRIRRCLGLKRRRAGSRNMARNEVSGADVLRRLVPGGKAMELCSLLEETSHFVQCLATQVKVMQSIADRYSV